VAARDGWGGEEVRSIEGGISKLSARIIDGSFSKRGTTEKQEVAKQEHAE